MTPAAAGAVASARAALTGIHHGEKPPSSALRRRARASCSAVGPRDCAFRDPSGNMVRFNQETKA
ncbi:hypothetical protein [Nonomuraea roseoviolacea]|uniref:hypothetical protein n=1 Tax=Nonomuraea roseoviolacea TaxID=103837 RepID=UPI0031DC8662